jgi:hypothetical protein
MLHLSLEPHRWLLLPRQGFGSFRIPVLTLQMKRSAPEDGSAYSTKPARESAKWNQVFPYVLFAGQGSSSTRSAVPRLGEGDAVAKAIATYKVG